jgi:putative ABC transport system permease protein
MFWNALKVTLRNLIRNKLYALISVVGLSIGITCCLLIFLYVQHELSFDRFHEKADSIDRLIRMELSGGEESQGSESLSVLAAAELEANIPEIVNTVRFRQNQYTVRHGEDSFNESVALVDPGFFKMFSFPLVHGDPNTVLADPGGVVISEEMTVKYFGKGDPTGETFTIQFGETPLDLMVTGVLENAPTNSSIQYSFIVSSELFKYAFPAWYLDTWDIVIIQTFAELSPGSDPAEVERKIAAYTESLFAGNEEQLRHYRLQPLTEIHLDNRYDGITTPSSDPKYSYILSAIALAVLLIACINFMSLAIGRSSGRAREVGLRKVLGAQRIQLMRQYWGEALFLSIAALLLAIVMVELFLPTFNTLAEKRLSLDLLSNWLLIPALAGTVLITAFIAGLYPALVISRLIPVDSLRGDLKVGGKNRLIQGLVILQFVISITLIVSTVIIASQIKYVSNYDLGYDKDPEGEEASKLVKRFRNELAGYKDVVNVAGYTYPFGQSWLYMNYGGEGMKFLIGEDVTGTGYTEDPEVADKYFYVNWVDAHYLPTMDIKVSQGRNFSDDFPSDVDGAIILNQTAAKAFGWDNPIGQQLPKGFRKARVVGVVEDFHFYPLHREIQPLLLHMNGTNFISSVLEIAVKVRSNNVPETIRHLEKTWGKVSGGMPFQYKFLDDQTADQYAAELRWRSIVQFSSIFTLLVACLGLIGLTSLAVAKRTKEVGIRKVLGASVANIVALFTGDFARLILIANLLAWPAAYLIMRRWLQDFSYRIDISIWYFIAAGAAVLGISLLTVSFQSIRAALADPVKSLRYE